MKIKWPLVFLIFFILPTMTVQAAVDTPALGTCLTDSLTGKERKFLAKWIFFAIAAHPEMAANSNITDEQRIETDKAVGALVTRLFVEDCPKEAKAAQKADPMVAQKAFQLVGKVAMQELMTNQKVMSAITNYGIYTDQSKINALFVE